MKGSFGFLPFIAGTLAVTLISLAIAIPLCILTAVYLTEYASDALKNMMFPLVNILAAIPLNSLWCLGCVIYCAFNSVVYGSRLWGCYIRLFCACKWNCISGDDFPIMISIMVEVLQNTL
jgi:phosphate transport system permease protein